MEDENIHVEQLIEPRERRSELSRLQMITTEEERLAIRSIHLSQTPMEDKLNWSNAIDRVARPKMAYRRIREQARDRQTSEEHG